MSPQDFCYWLQGVLEVTKPEQLDKEQLAMVREHLDLVFTKVTSVPKVEPVISRRLCASGTAFDSTTKIC